jgi:branched-chain amino acid transport system permease protein
VAFVVAIGMGAITLRLKGVYFTIFTFGLVELLKNLILWSEIHFTGRRGRFVVTAKAETVYYYLLGLTVLLIIVTFIIRRSRFGKALDSIGESEEAAAHIGVNTTLFKILAFALSSFFMGAVGAAMATRLSYIDPQIAFDSLKSFLPVLMVIFGSMRRPSGPIIGAAVFAYLQELLRTGSVIQVALDKVFQFLLGTKGPSVYPFSIGIIMVIAILFMPEGIVGLAVKIIDKVSGTKRRASHAQSKG